MLHMGCRKRARDEEDDDLEQAHESKVKAVLLMTRNEC